MLKINFQNIEDIIFYNSELREKLKDFEEIFKRWETSKIIHILSHQEKQAKIDLLNNVDVTILENHFQTKILIEKVDTQIIKNYEFPIDQCEKHLKTIKTYSNMFVFRNKDQIYLSFWR